MNLDDLPVSEREPNAECRQWHDNSYARAGFAAQRRYPNEELLRFMGRNYFGLSKDRRADTRVLEVGCGSGANLWMLAHEGFDAHGVDLSASGIGLCVQMLGQWKTQGKVKVGDMTALDYPTGYFDAVVDVFSAYCLDERGFSKFLNEVRRVLKPGGRFFAYTPSKGSDVFKRAENKIDASTLNGVPDGGPFSGNKYPFRFIGADEFKDELQKRDLRVPYLESVGRSYGTDYFEFVVIEGQK